MSERECVKTDQSTPIYKLPPSGPDGNQYTSVPLGKKKKTPRRILHFSDGILEEYSTDEDEDTVPIQPPVDPKTLMWMPWMWYYMSTCAYKVYTAADFCGEKLAWFFGITTPKYQSAIDDYYRRKEEEEREMAEEEKKAEEAKGLSAINVNIIQDKPIGVTNLDKY